MSAAEAGQAWHRGCAIGDLDGGGHLAAIGGRKVVILKVDGRLFAFDDFCPHSGGPMHRGELEGCVLTCPLHGWRFDLEQAGAELHGLRPLPMYPARQSGNDVEVFL